MNLSFEDHSVIHNTYLHEKVDFSAIFQQMEILLGGFTVGMYRKFSGFTRVFCFRGCFDCFKKVVPGVLHHSMKLVKQGYVGYIQVPHVASA